MADYIYLLENRLSEAQRSALGVVRQVARDKGLTVFLVGGAVRDLTSGSPVRDLDVVVQGNALKLRKELEAAGAVLAGSADAYQALYVRFPGGVRMEVGSTLSVTYPKPGKAVAKPATILDDLRRRDFTANAMALSLNDGSYGLLMDPLNGVADIENRELRLASNYGFIEDPVRMIRAMRFLARLGWELEEKTRTRYETGKQEGYIKALDDFHRGYEAEEIVHEEDPLRIMRRLESEGWMQTLMPAWTVAKANLGDLEKVRESQTQLQMQGIHPDAAAINFPLLTAKMSAKEIQALKASFPRQGFVAEIDSVEAEAKEFATTLGGRGASNPSSAYRAIVAAKPEALLYVLYTTKSGALQAKLKSFMTEWPQARQRIPFALMQEMRITPELSGYGDLVEQMFFELMDGKLATPEEMKAFLEPFSPPAPPPPVHVKRPRTAKKDAKGKAKAKKGAAADADEDEDSDSADFDVDGEDAVDAPRGAEEDEEAEDAAEDMDAVAELGGSRSRKDDSDEEEEDEEEEEERASSRKAPVSRKPATALKTSEPAVAVAVEKPSPVPSEKVSAPPAGKAKKVDEGLPVVAVANAAPAVPEAVARPQAVAPAKKTPNKPADVDQETSPTGRASGVAVPAKAQGKAAPAVAAKVVAVPARSVKVAAKAAVDTKTATATTTAIKTASGITTKAPSPSTPAKAASKAAAKKVASTKR